MATKPYFVCLVKGLVGVEERPTIYCVDLTEQQHHDFDRYVSDFNQERMPAYYPELYLYPFEPQDPNTVLITLEEHKEIEASIHREQSEFDEFLGDKKRRGRGRK